MEYLVEARSEHKKKFVEAILPSIIQQLGLTRSRKTLLIRIANECGQGNEGMTMPLDGIDSYVVVVRPGTLAQIGVTLAHEMVHVKQMAKGTLKPKNGINFWRGKRYAKNTKYLNMPWEVEAFSKQELIFRRSIQ
jgi:hypothetical protein